LQDVTCEAGYRNL